MTEHAARNHECQPPAEAGGYTDPVCGMRVEANEERKVTHSGETYYFCSDHCAARF
ncbi:MAG: YHS domain-containing protein, partial [Gammaproteobacteria bacterium]|nr:YHS domain-containing protein [Gammaproteobacteria bacterium]